MTISENAYKTLLLDLSPDGILTVTMNRPERLNAVNEQMHHELARVFEDIERADEVKAAILTGAGRGFCGGGDFGKDVDLDSVYNEVFGNQPGRGPVYKIVHDLVWMTKPIVAAVNGPAVGLGATLALLCDVVYMAEGAVLGDRHVKMGLTAGDGGAVIWPWLVGVNRAKEILMLGQLVDGKEAQRMGLVNHAVPDGQALSAATECAKEFVALPPLAVRTTKAATQKALMIVFNAAMEMSAEFEARCFRSQDAAEAAAAFREKRPAVFMGR